MQIEGRADQTACDVICPNSADVTLPFGAENCGVLKRLKHSILNCPVTFFSATENAKFLLSTESIFLVQSVRTSGNTGPTLPNV